MKTPERIQQITASERISNLEKAVMQTIEAAQSLAQQNARLNLENERLKNSLVEMSYQIQAIVEIQSLKDKVNEFVVKATAKELEERVNLLVDSGEIEKEDVVNEKSLVVAKEADKENNTTSPRVQFMIENVPDLDLKALLLEKVVGDKIEYKNSIVEILEIYKIVQK